MTATVTRQPNLHVVPADRTVDTHSSFLARLARQALIAEVNLTPKPGLVDLRSAGAHKDLSVTTMYLSATALEPYFAEMAQAALGQNVDAKLFETLRRIGRDAEDAMYTVTGGANSHKGAIWTLGLLVASASLTRASNRKSRYVAATAGSIAAFQQTTMGETLSHGELVRQRFAVPGAREEAQLAFPHVIAIGLPVLRRRRAEGAREDVARIDCLLAIMSHLDDTCLLYRAGLPGLSTAQVGARTVLTAGGAGTAAGRQELQRLHEQLLQLNCSPGGSADLLAATLFVDAVDQGTGEIESATNRPMGET